MPPVASTVAPVTEPPMPDAEREAELAHLVRRFALAEANGWSPEACVELETDYRALAQRSPKQPAPLFGLALVLEACGEIDQAKSIYESLPSFAPALVNLGRLEWTRGDLDGAISRFEQAIAADPAPGTFGIIARNNLAATLADRHRRTRSPADFEAAERSVQGVLAYDSDNQLAYENLARLYYDHGRIEEPSYRLLAQLVVAQGQRVLDRRGLHSAELENLGGLLWLLEDDPAQAIRAFERAVEIDPEHVDAHRNLALVAIRFRGFERAERSLSTVLRDPVAAADVEVWLALGVARRGLGDLDGAAAAYQQAAVLAPDDPRPWFDLGVLAQDHRVLASETSDQLISLAEEAAGHFEEFVDVAGAAPRWQAAVGVANDRIALARDTITVIEAMDLLVYSNPPVDLIDPVVQQLRIEELLQLEREAARAGSQTDPDTSPSPRRPDEEIQRLLELEAQAILPSNE